MRIFEETSPTRTETAKNGRRAPRKTHRHDTSMLNWGVTDPFQVAMLKEILDGEPVLD